MWAACRWQAVHISPDYRGNRPFPRALATLNFVFVSFFVVIYITQRMPFSLSTDRKHCNRFGKSAVYCSYRYQINKLWFYLFHSAGVY